jgi:hypothetical protein
MSYRDQDLRSITELALKLKWFQLEGLEKVKFKPVHGDLVVRDEGEIDQKLAAMVSVIKQETGQAVTFVKTPQTRPCIRLDDGTNSPGFPLAGSRKSGVIVLTQKPWDGTEMAMWSNRMANQNTMPRDIRYASKFQDAARFLEAPFLDDELPHGQLNWTGRFIIASDARLSRNDPEYQAKLQRVLDNIRAQVEGDWKIESAEVEVYTLQPAPATAPTTAPSEAPAP